MSNVICPYCGSEMFSPICSNCGYSDVNESEIQMGNINIGNITQVNMSNETPASLVLLGLFIISMFYSLFSIYVALLLFDGQSKVYIFLMFTSWVVSFSLGMTRLVVINIKKRKGRKGRKFPPVPLGDD